MDWIDDNDMRTVLLRHYPGLRAGDARRRERLRALEPRDRLTPGRRYSPLSYLKEMSSRTR